LNLNDDQEQNKKNFVSHNIKNINTKEESQTNKINTKITTCQNKHVKVFDVINLEVDIQIAKERLKQRSINLNRSDDTNDAAVINRINVYIEETKPVLQEFRNNFLG